MSNYRRAYQEGGCYFFTVVTYHRQPLLSQIQNIERLRGSFTSVSVKRPFVVDAVVVLHDHLHCIWRLPDGDEDFSTRWRLIRRHFSLTIDTPLTKRGEKLVWQRRFWEHLIRDEEDWRRHLDYIHYNPVKHGYVRSPRDWPSSSFHRAVKQGWYLEDWGSEEPENLKGMNLD
jgi:putative transposase